MSSLSVDWTVIEGTSVCRLVLDRPSHANALDAPTVEELHGALDRVEETRAALVVFEGRGSAFCSGFDLSELEDETDATLLHRLVRIQLLLERVQSLPGLTVALVEQPAVGAGADLVLATSTRLALNAASLRFPGSGFGAVLGVARLAAETSPTYAAEVALTGRRLDAAEAERRGLWRVLESRADLEAELERLARRVGVLPVGTGARLRNAAACVDQSDPLGDLVRSLAATPGLHQRVRAYRDRSRLERKTVPLGGTR